MDVGARIQGWVMKTSLQFCGTFLLLTAGLVGCRNAAPPGQHPETTPLVGVGPDVGHPATAPQDVGQSQPEPPPVPGTAKALAQRAATYAQSVEPVVTKHAAGKAAKSDWPDPEALRLTPQPDADQAAVPLPVAHLGDGTKTKGSQANASIAIPTAHHLVTDTRLAAGASVIPPEVADALTPRLAGRARDYPSDLCAQADNQLLKLLKDDAVADMASLAGLIPEDRELLSALMDSLSNFRNQLRADNNMLFSKKIRPMLELADRLRSQAELSVPTVSLCTGVKAFGIYDPIDPARFIAGREQRVVVYCEVENFLSQPNEKNLYETRLTQDIVLYEESSGLPVWTDKRSTYIDQARRRRHDFFMGKIITLPANLTINRYLLKVTVEDQQARHIAENTVPIEIVAQ
jgi:hypothetical protein